jgi:hypothetical protein
MGGKFIKELPKAFSASVREKLISYLFHFIGAINPLSVAF